jgi:hypothetical protein
MPQPELPILLLSTDNSLLGVFLTVDRAEKYLVQPAPDDPPNQLWFDGLARPLEARVIAGQANLVVTQSTADPWQVRVRVTEALKLKGVWLTGQDDRTFEHAEVSRAETEERLRNLRTSIERPMTFPEFACALIKAFYYPDDPPWNPLCVIFHC